jgi:hypothetical protein
LRVKAIVGSFEPERSESQEKRLKSALVLAALEQALRREAPDERVPSAIHRPGIRYATRAHQQSTAALDPRGRTVI